MKLFKFPLGWTASAMKLMNKETLKGAESEAIEGLRDGSRQGRHLHAFLSLIDDSLQCFNLALDAVYMRQGLLTAVPTVMHGQYIPYPLPYVNHMRDTVAACKKGSLAPALNAPVPQERINNVLTGQTNRTGPDQ